MQTTATSRILLRLEGAALFALSLVMYARSGSGWGTFAAWFLVPDISLAGYLLGPRVGAVTYNTLHSEIGPVLLGMIALSGALPSLLPIALIWASHVGFDRALGYGLKSMHSFSDTHLGPIGKAARSATATPVASVAV